MASQFPFKPHVTKKNPSIKFQAQLQGLLLFKHGEKPPHGAKKMKKKMKFQILLVQVYPQKFGNISFLFPKNQIILILGIRKKLYAKIGSSPKPCQLTQY
jgi:hypothetical protein